MISSSPYTGPRGARRGAMPRFCAKTYPSCPLNEVWHHPLLHLPTSTEVPFGISVSTALLVPGEVRRLVSPARVTGLAVAQAAGTRMKMAAHAAIRTELMAIHFLLPACRRPRPSY